MGKRGGEEGAGVQSNPLSLNILFSWEFWNKFDILYLP